MRRSLPGAPASLSVPWRSPDGAVPCSVPKVAQGQFDFNGEALSEGATISHGEVVKFSCQAGYNVLGSETMRCWYGAWAVTGQNPKCQPGES